MPFNKTVNATFSVTRDGITTAHPMPKVNYARYGAVEVALIGGLVTLCAMGLRHAADLIEADTDHGPGHGKGRNDVAFRLQADHGLGTSEFSAAYTALDLESADGMVALMMGAFNAAMK